MERHDKLTSMAEEQYHDLGDVWISIGDCVSAICQTDSSGAPLSVAAGGDRSASRFAFA